MPIEGINRPMSDTAKREIEVFCRQCGGDRYHSTPAEKVDEWSDEDHPIWGVRDGPSLNVAVAGR
jgi:hypothetical protein